MKKNTLIFVCILLSFHARSQEVYSDAKILNLIGDTTNVLISNFTSSKEITYKNNSSTKPSTIHPNQIKGYLVNGNTYLSKFINITEYTINRDFSDMSFIYNGIFLEKNSAVKPYKDSVYLQLLVKGKVNLYQFTPKDNYKSFYIERDGKIYELPPIHFVFKKDTLRGFGYFVQNGVYNQIPRLSGTFTEQNKYLDTLQKVMPDDIYFEQGSFRNIKYDIKDLVATVLQYNMKYPEENPEVVYKKKGLGKIYLGLNIGGITPFKDYYANDDATLSATKSLAYSVFALIPDYGKNRHLFYKIAYHNFNYDLFIQQKTGELRINRDISSVALGLRYAGLRGMFRPFFGSALTYTWQKANNVPVFDGLLLLFEFGGVVPVKKVNLVFQGNFAPILPKQNGFQLLSYSVGLMF